MPKLENLTDFAACDFLSTDIEGGSLLVVCVAGLFKQPRGDCPSAKVLSLDEVQIHPPMEDIYFGAPGTPAFGWMARRS